MKVKKYRNYLKENRLFIIFIVIMSISYAFDLYYRKPWYDELYTYYSFISRGPVYSAIHWPVPNNHILYSVLSAFLDYFGNSYIGLRGISFLASILNLFLLYEFAKKIMNHRWALSCTLLYAAAYQIHYLSVQGRGYTLTITFYLIALHSLYLICQEQGKLIHYVIFACSLTGGLYTIVSSTFWVLPVCFVGGFYLLYKKNYKTLLRLIFASLIAACMTLFLYTVVWLAIGSNLLCKNPDSVYYGIYQITIILMAPVKALRTGMEYMLATPYIQGDTRGYIISELFNYLSGVFDLHYLGLGKMLTVFLIIATVLIGIYFIKKGNKEGRFAFFCIYFLTSSFMLPFMLIIQSVQPYYRVFSFFSVPLTLLLVYLLDLGIQFLQKKLLNINLEWVCFFFVLAFGFFTITREEYHSQYASRENEIADIMKESANDLSTIFYCDDFQKYVLKFYYDLEPVESAMGAAEYILVPKEIMKEEYTVPQWPTLYSYDSINWGVLKAKYTVIKETANYYLYQHH